MGRKASSERRGGNEDSAASAIAGGAKSRWFRAGIGTLVFVAFVVFVEWYLGWSSLLASSRSLSAAAAGAAIAMLLASYLARALRFYSYFHDRMRGNLLLCIKLTWYHNLFNYLLPMRAGELAFPILIRRYFAVPAATSLPALVWFRLLDFHTVVLFALLALPLVAVPVWATGILAAGWLSLAWFAHRSGARLAARIAKANVSRRPGWILDALQSMPGDDRRFLVAWAWTLANWIAKLTVVTMGIVELVGAPPMLSLAAAVAGEATMVLPIHSIAAAGTYEAGLVGVLGGAGIAIDTALAGSINLHLFLVFGTLTTGLIAAAIPAGRARDAGGTGERTDEQADEQQ